MADAGYCVDLTRSPISAAAGSTEAYVALFADAALARTMPLMPTMRSTSSPDRITPRIEGDPE